jgi:hypothetical protein
MRLTFLGKDSQGGQSPTLYATDRDTYVVQGWRVPDDPAAVEIPPGLLRFAKPGTIIETTTTIAGTHLVTGALVTDAEALAQMDMPDHETCVEVGKVAV